MFVYFLVFGLLTLVGGVMGYVKAGSLPSLIAGSVAGLLLILGDLLAFGNYRKVGATLLLLVSLLLLGRFAPSLLKGKLNPAAYIVPLSVVGTVLSVMLWSSLRR